MLWKAIKGSLKTTQGRTDFTSSGSPGAAGGVVLQHPVDVGDVDASGHHVRAHQDPTGTQIGEWLVWGAPAPSSDASGFVAEPLQSPEVCEDLVALVFHLAVDEVDGDLLDEGLQSSAEVLHARARTEGEGEEEGWVTTAAPDSREFFLSFKVQTLFVFKTF